MFSPSFCLVYGLSPYNVQHPTNLRWHFGVHFAWGRFQGSVSHKLLLQAYTDRLHDRQTNFQNTYLGGILIAVAFLNAFIEFYQLQKSEAILASFLAMIPPACRVVRNSTLQTIPAADLVKGDVVLIVSNLLIPCCPNYDD